MKLRAMPASAISQEVFILQRIQASGRPLPCFSACLFRGEHALLLYSRSKREIRHPCSGREIQAVDPEHQPDAGPQLQVRFGWF